MKSRIIAFCVLLLLSFIPLEGQQGYFGQNKVQFKSLHFQVLQTPHFEIYYYAEEKPAIGYIARMAERWYTRLTRILRHPLLSKQPLIIYADQSDFSQSTVIPGMVEPGVGGVTLSQARQIVLPLAGPLAETDHVLGHELAHAYEMDMTTNPRSGAPAISNLPLWFVEGLSEYLSLGTDDPQTTMWLRDAARRNQLPTIEKLDSSRYFPYRFGHAFWAYVAGRYGEEKIAPLLTAAAGGGLDRALENQLQAKRKEISNGWLQANQAALQPVLAATQATAPHASRLIGVADKRGQYYISPALSPDGSKVMLFSARGRFAMDLYLADVRSGKILHQITTTATSAHFENLEFINSSGAWNAAGDQFVLGRTHDGRAELAFYDTNRARITRIAPVPGVGEVLNPCWSPDGRQIVFSALKGGLSDLYLMEVATGRIRPLTNDAYADLQPAWSPDGRKIAFVTDRYSTRLDTLSYGHYQLAMLDTQKNVIQRLPTLAGANTINPQWSPDGRYLYFVSDSGGIANLYRLALNSGTIEAESNLQTGVAGITPLSPAISVAARSGDIVFSTFENSGYTLWRMPAPGANAEVGTRDKLAGLHAGLLPPWKAPGGKVNAYLNAPECGLPPETASYASNPYKARLRLTDIVPASIGLGVSTYGPAFGGGTALQFQDLLKTQSLTLAVSTITSNGTSDFMRNFSGIASFQNAAHRWQWGFAGGQIPLITGTFGAQLGTVSGHPVQMNQFTTYWEMDRQALGMLAYPINRAQRLEFAAGFENIGFAARTEMQIWSLETGGLLADVAQDMPAPKSLNFATGYGALVYDTSIFGGTSPVRGQRYHLQYGASGGSLFFGTALLDYRRYQPLAEPLSLAVRIMHFGRYGSGANDLRLQDYFLGYPDLVRGYSLDSFRAEECGPSFYSRGECPIFNRLLGSRLATGNVELRLELLGPLGVLTHAMLPPVELAPFYDAGMAWSGPYQAGLPKHVETSEGTTLRINLFGIAIGAITYAIPNQRPLTHHIWEFDLLPGF